MSKEKRVRRACQICRPEEVETEQSLLIRRGRNRTTLTRRRCLSVKRKRAESQYKNRSKDDTSYVQDVTGHSAMWLLFFNQTLPQGFSPLLPRDFYLSTYLDIVLKRPVTSCCNSEI